MIRRRSRVYASIRGLQVLELSSRLDVNGVLTLGKIIVNDNDRGLSRQYSGHVEDCGYIPPILTAERARLVMRASCGGVAGWAIYGLVPRTAHGAGKRSQ